MADIELEDLGGAEAETVPTIVIANPSLKTTNLGASQEIETAQQDEPRQIKNIENEAGDIETGEIESGSTEAPPQDNEAAQSTYSRSSDHKGCNCCSKDVLKNLLYLAVIIICALLAVVVYQRLWYINRLWAQNKPLPQRFYDENYMRYLAYFPPGSRSKPNYLTKREVFWHANACGTELNRKPSDPQYFTSNQDIPLEPAVTGFMGQFGTYRFLSMYEMMAMFIGEEKHGMWRYQENGFVRVYRDKSKKVGIQLEDKEKAIESGLYYADEDKYTRNDTLLGILKTYYMNFDPALDFDYAFGPNVTSNITNADGRIVEVLNWIDLPIYHEKFTRKYKNHVPIDTPAYFCQLSGPNLPHAKLAWQLIMAQEKANKVGPLGIRAGLDVKENYVKIIQLNWFPGATAWANIGQGNPETDEMLKTLREMMERVQTVNYQAIDQEKVDIEIYLAERGYHNKSATYVQFIAVMMDKTDAEAYTYLRPDGYYYDVLVKLNETAKDINQDPVFDFKISIRGEEEQRKVYSTPAFALSNPNRTHFKLTGGACPAKGGDLAQYPWGNPGSAWMTNYEEVIPLCDAILLDLRFWANLGDDMGDPYVKLGNSGAKYNKSEVVEYFTQSNLYGRFTDPYNKENDIVNPYEIDLTTNHKTKYKNSDETATFRINFGKIGTLNKINIPDDLDIAPVGCVAKNESSTDYCGPNKDD